MQTSEADRRDQENSGPFPDTAGRDRPWEPVERTRGPFERRRRGDRRAQDPAGTAVELGNAGGRSRPRGRRRSDVLDTGTEASGRARVLARRFREPLIGLTLAGLAVPLINAAVTAPAEPADQDVDRAGSTDLDEAVLAGRDLEEGVGEYWAEAEEEVVRSQTIDGAATRWAISPVMAEQIYDAATRHDIEPDVAFGLVFVESTFRERAVSHVGARGLSQVMPRTARWLDPSVRAQDLFDPEVNLDLGFRYLRMMIDKYDGNVHNALTAYNRGPGTVDRILRRGGNPDNGYAGKVLAG